MLMFLKRYSNSYFCSFGLSAFACQRESKKLRGRTNLRLEYTRAQVTFPFFQVWYKYQAASEQLLESWKEKDVRWCRCW